MTSPRSIVMEPNVPGSVDGVDLPGVANLRRHELLGAASDDQQDGDEQESRAHRCQCAGRYRSRCPAARAATVSAIRRARVSGRFAPSTHVTQALR